MKGMQSNYEDLLESLRNENVKSQDEYKGMIEA